MTKGLGSRATTFLSELHNILEDLDLQVVGEFGRFTDGMPACLEDLLSATDAPSRVVSGWAVCKAYSARAGVLTIERGTEFGWHVMARSADGTPFGLDGSVLQTDTRNYHVGMTPDAQDALTCIRAVLGDPRVTLRGSTQHYLQAKRQADGKDFIH